MFKKCLCIVGGLSILSGCTDLEQALGVPQTVATSSSEVSVETGVDTAPMTAISPPKVIKNTGSPKKPEALDVATAEERKDAITIEPVSSEKKLGIAIASLGNPAETGFWVKSDLVSKPTKGRITDLATGTQVNVDLFPAESAQSGTQLSLSAMRALGVSLIDLPEVQLVQLM